jgi:hypothetical protein
MIRPNRPNTHAVKQDVKSELAKKAVGHAATEDDWAARKKIEKSTATPTKAPDGGATAGSDSTAAQTAQEPNSK